jgi:hypothetical protein
MTSRLTLYEIIKIAFGLIQNSDTGLSEILDEIFCKEMGNWGDEFKHEAAGPSGKFIQTGLKAP